MLSHILNSTLISGFRSSVIDKKDDHVLFFSSSDNFELLTQQCSSEDEPKVKVCLYCVSVLKRVTQEVSRKLSSTGTEILYKQLVKKMDEVREIKPVFLKAVDCINKVGFISSLLEAWSNVDCQITIYALQYISFFSQFTSSSEFWWNSMKLQDTFLKHLRITLYI